MDISQQLELLARMVRLIEEMQNSADYLGKQDVIAHLRW
jgi:hypothetical protein